MSELEKKKSRRPHWDDKRPEKKEKKEFEEKLLEVRKVTRVTTWWRQMAFRATILVWNRNWKIWIWVAKWPDVAIAVAKATHDAYKNIKECYITSNWSVPYSLTKKFKAAYVKIIPALPGTWLKAWSAVRTVLELAWYKNILSKIVWTNNKLNNAILTADLLSTYKKFVKNNSYFIKWIQYPVVHTPQVTPEVSEELVEAAE